MYKACRFKFIGKDDLFFLQLFKRRDKELMPNLDEQLENLFGDLNAGAELKFHRQKEYIKKIKSRGIHK